MRDKLSKIAVAVAIVTEHLRLANCCLFTLFESLSISPLFLPGPS